MSKSQAAQNVVISNQHVDRCKRELTKWEKKKSIYEKKLMEYMELDGEKTYKVNSYKFSVRNHRDVTEVTDLLSFMKWFKEKCPTDRENFEKLFMPTKRKLGSFIREYFEGVDAIESVIGRVDGVNHEISYRTISVREL
jgi:hypothetical protein